MIAIFLVCTVICAAWLIWGSQNQYDVDPDGEEDEMQNPDNWGV